MFHPQIRLCGMLMGCCYCSSALMWRYSRIPAALEQAGQGGCRSTSLLCLDGLLKVFSFVLQRHPARIKHFLCAVGETLHPPGHLSCGNCQRVNVTLSTCGSAGMTLKHIVGSASGNKQDLFVPIYLLVSGFSAYNVQVKSLDVFRCHWGRGARCGGLQCDEEHRFLHPPVSGTARPARLSMLLCPAPGFDPCFCLDPCSTSEGSGDPDQWSRRWFQQQGGPAAAKHFGSALRSAGALHSTGKALERYRKGPRAAQVRLWSSTGKALEQHR